MKNPEDNKKEYFDFYLKEVVPKVEELVNASGHKKRKQIQMKIISTIKGAGYDSEAKRLKAIFNL